MSDSVKKAGFVRYVLGFYDAQGIYPLIREGKPLTRRDINAILPVYALIARTHPHRDAPSVYDVDSNNREIFRDIAERLDWAEQ